MGREALRRVEHGACAGALRAGGSPARATHLQHELRDDAVEGAALEVQRLAHLAHALLARAERAEVLGRLGLRRRRWAVGGGVGVREKARGGGGSGGRGSAEAGERGGGARAQVRAPPHVADGGAEQPLAPSHSARALTHHDVREEVHVDAAGRLAADRDVEEDARVGHLDLVGVVLLP
jgi:hypothetical protein